MKNAVLPFRKCLFSFARQFYFVKIDENYKKGLELAVSVLISSQLQIKACDFSYLIPKDQYTVYPGV